MVGADRWTGCWATTAGGSPPTLPDLEEARELASRLEVEIRYEGPDGAVDDATTTLPAIGDGPARRPDELLEAADAWGRGGYLADAPNGGRYLFAWEFGQRAQRRARPAAAWCCSSR